MSATTEWIKQILKPLLDNIWCLIIGCKMFFWFIVDTYEYLYFSDKGVKDEENIQGKVVVITGGNRGIGKAVAREFACRGATVVVGCRDMKSGRKAIEEIKAYTGNQNVVVHHLDLADMQSVRTFAAKVKCEFPAVKILINNAGIVGSSTAHEKTVDGFEVQMAINHLGHFLLTNLLLPNLKQAAPSRVVSLSSSRQIMSRLDLSDFMMDNSDQGFANGVSYDNSKLAISLFIKELGKRLCGTGVTTYSLCPGAVTTDIHETTPFYYRVGFMIIMAIIGITAEQSCCGVLHCCLSKSAASESGIMYRFKKHLNSANKMLTSEDAEKAWNISAKLVNL